MPRTLEVAATPHGFGLSAQRATLDRVLRELAHVGRFRLQLGPDPRLAAHLATPVTLRRVDADLAEILAVILPGVPFTLHFDVDARGGGTHLRLVRVGFGEAPGIATAQPDAKRSTRASPPRERAPLGAEEVERRSAEHAREQAELLVRIHHPDPETRAEAAEWIEPDAEGLERLKELLERDPAPDVRIAAAGALIHATAPGAVDLLIEALSDPNPGVAIAALDAIEFVGDATLIPKLAPALTRPEAEVRARAQETVEFLQP
jgi:hypothetical protein